MELWRFKPGDVLHLHDGSRARVLAPSEDGQWIKVRYQESGDDPLFSGTEDLVADGEIAGFTPAPPGPEWAQTVVAVVYHVPESEESEEGYEAVTMSGTPLGVSITSSDVDTAQEALDRLIAALKVFGYSGTVSIEDATYVGRVQRYDVQA